MGYACMTNGGMGQHLEKPDFAKAVEWFKLALDGKRSDQQLEDEASSFPGVPRSVHFRIWRSQNQIDGIKFFLILS